MRLGWLLLLLPLAAFGQNSANGNSNINFSTYLASPGPIGGTTPNTGAFSGLSVVPSSTTGANAQSANFTLNYFQNVLTGNLFNDPQLSMGYNIGSTANYTKDPFAAGLVVDGNYETQSGIPDSGGSGATVSGNTLTDSTSGGQTGGWAPHIFKGLTLYDSTDGLSTQITDNTGTTITGTSMAGWSASGVTYNILDPTLRISQQFVSNANTASSKTVTVQQTSFDRAFAAQQALLGTGGKVAITNITSATTAGGAGGGVLQAAVAHGLDNTKVVRIYGITVSGGTAGTQWTKLNGQQVAVITSTTSSYTCSSADATHFCINVNTTLLTGTPSFTNAYYIAEPSFNEIGRYMVDANQGMLISSPAWDGEAQGNIGVGAGDQPAPCGGSVIAQLLQGQFTLCGYAFNEANKLTIESGYNADATLELYYGGKAAVDFNGYGNGQFQIQPIRSGSYGSGTVIGQQDSNNIDVHLAVGQGAELGGIINANNVGATASIPIFYADLASSQTGNIMTIRYGGNSYTCCALQIDPTGLYTGAGFISGGGNGTKFSVTTGCASSTSLTGGPTAGKFTCGTTTTAATLTITMGATAPNGWVCNIDDTTSKLHFANTTDTTTTCSATVTITSGDVVKFSAIGY